MSGATAIPRIAGYLLRDLSHQGARMNLREVRPAGQS